MSLIVRIYQYDFPIFRQYSAGHVLTEGEAAALNQVLVENIRNNVAPWIARETKGNRYLTADEYEDMATRISEYAENYQFKLRIRARPANPLDAAIRDMAREHAEAWGIANDHEPDSREVYAKYIELRQHKDIQRKALDLIIQRQSVVDKAMEDLLDGC